MSLTPIQERRLKQVEDEIVFLQKEKEKKGLWYALRLSWIVVMLVYISNFFFALLLENTSLSDYVNEYGWKKILTSWAFWFLVDYFFVVRGNHQTLKNKKKELAKLRIKYGLVEKAVS